MQHNLNIDILTLSPWLQAEKAEKRIDYTDAAILAYVRHLAGSEAEAVRKFRYQGHHMLTHEYLRESLCLNLKDRGLRNRLKKLSDLGLLSVVSKLTNTGRVNYYALGTEYHKSENHYYHDSTAEPPKVEESYPQPICKKVQMRTCISVPSHLQNSADNPVEIDQLEMNPGGEEERCVEAVSNHQEEREILTEEEVKATIDVYTRYQERFAKKAPARASPSRSYEHLVGFTGREKPGDELDDQAKKILELNGVRVGDKHESVQKVAT